MISAVGYSNYTIPYAGVTASGNAATAVNKISGVIPVGQKNAITVGKAQRAECGTPYVTGGKTTTTIQYNENNPYENSRKSVEGSFLKGMNFDAVA